VITYVRQQEPLLGGPHVHEVEGAALRGGMSQGAAEGLAVQRDGLAREIVEKRLQPPAEGVLKCHGVERLEDATEGVGARRATGHLQESGEELGAHFGVELEGLPAIGAADGAEQRHGQHIDQRVELPALDSRVRDAAERIQ
jgi:hypothetical protein